MFVDAVESLTHQVGYLKRDVIFTFRISEKNILKLNFVNYLFSLAPTQIVPILIMAQVIGHFQLLLLRLSQPRRVDGLGGEPRVDHFLLDALGDALGPFNREQIIFNIFGYFSTKVI